MKRRSAVRSIAVIGAVSAGAALVLGAAPAAAVGPDPVAFTTAGCQVWQVPDGVTVIRVDGTGAAGGSFSGLAGGAGDGMSAILTGLTPGLQLDVCVDVGGGAPGGTLSAGHPGGGVGGGASGVSLGGDFSQPLLVAGGGGGFGGGDGGSAGQPVAGDGTIVLGACGAGLEDGCPGLGGDNTLGLGGAAGAGDNLGATAGGGVTAAGPGAGGHGAPGGHFDGGGGGAGYYGGGGSGAGSYGSGGGGGGTDYCPATTVSTVTVSGCVRTAAAGTQHDPGAAAGQAQVLLTPLLTQTITYTSNPAAHPRVGETYRVSASGGDSGNPVTFTRNSSSAGVCSVVDDGIDTATVSFSGTGICAVFAHQAGTAVYAPATAPARQRIHVFKRAQTITFTSTPGHLRVGDHYTVSATGGGSPNPVTFTRAAASAGICGVNDHGDDTATVTLTGRGTCSLFAHQQGSGEYAAAETIRQQFHVYPAA